MRRPDRMILQLFRAVALVEGLSFVALIGVAMPLKYMANMPQAVHMAGSAHGALFIAYMAVLLAVLLRRLLPAREAFNAFGFSFLPLGPFFGDRPLRQILAA